MAKPQRCPACNVRTEPGTYDLCQLHASAPDLLLALVHISRGLTNGDKEQGTSLEDIARAAIEQAKR